MFIALFVGVMVFIVGGTVSIVKFELYPVVKLSLDKSVTAFMGY
jgi:hypothetical protein